MRVLIAVVSLVGVAVLLQGCGGGGSSTSCLNDNFNVVSQSLSGTVDGNAVVTMGKTSTTSKISGTVSEKMDLEQWTFRGDMTFPIKAKVAGVEFDGMLEGKAIFNASAKVAVVWYKLTNNTGAKAKVTHSCKTHTFKSMPNPETLSMLWKSAVLPRVQAAAKCGGNDGTYDTWNMGGALPIPGSVPGSGNVVAKIAMDKDYLLHSVTTTDDGEMPGPPAGTVKGSLDQEVSAASAGGPKTADLDYSSWGECDPSDELDIETLFMPPHGSEASSVFQVIGHRGFFQNHVLATLKASLELHQKTTLVV